MKTNMEYISRAKMGKGNGKKESKQKNIFL